MNRRQVLTIMVASGTALVPSVLHACEMTFKPSSVKADASGKATFVAQIRLEHRKCVIDLPPDCINLSPKGLKIVKQGGWKKVRRSRYECEYTVQLKGKSGELRVWRECSKKGISEGTVKVVRG